MSDKVIFRLKGHESFYIREGWLTKGMAAIQEDEYVFSKFYGADALGVGSNMAKAIRYWLKACNISVEEIKKTTASFLTDNLGKIIYSNDLYMEDIFTIWIIHINLIENVSMATIWYLFFNRLDLEEFTREEVIKVLKKEFIRYTRTDDFSQRSLNDDCNVLLNMYAKGKKKFHDPEDKTISPFTYLELLKFSGKNYTRVQPNLDKLDKLAVLYLINPLISSKKGISIDELLIGENGAMKVLNLKAGAFNEYLDRLSDDGYITVNRTSGLNMVYGDRKLSRSDILKIYYKKGTSNDK